MARGELTALQRKALEQVELARAAGLSLSAHCRAQGLAVRPIYDALIPLRRRGVIAAGVMRAAKPFVAVKIAPPMCAQPGVSLPRPRVLPVCRVVISGVSIECSEWPPRAWLESLASEPTNL
jgi:hypothetical protein